MSSTISLNAVFYGITPCYSTLTKLKLDPSTDPESVLAQIAKVNRMSKDFLRNARIFFVYPPIPGMEQIDSGLAIPEGTLVSWLEHLSSVTADKFPQTFCPPGLLERKYSLWYSLPLSKCLLDWDMGIFQEPGSINTFVVGPVPGMKRKYSSEDAPSSESSPSGKVRNKVSSELEEPSVSPSEASQINMTDGTIRKRVKAKIMGLLERIQQSTPPNDRLTNPEVSSHLVYPVLSAHTGDCQDFLPWSSISEDEARTVKFRGRKLVQRIVEMLLKLYGRPGCPHCRLFGTFGAGLTHLMLAAVNSLLAAGYPVVWIPIQSGRIRPAFIRNALLLALAARRTTDSETFTDLFHRCNDDPRDLFRFTNHLADKKIRLIFVYLNFDKATKDDAQFYFNLASGHVFCMTGNPNSTFCKEGELKPWTIEVFHLKGGLQDDEKNGWWSQYEEELGFAVSQKDRETISTTTGLIPRLLENLIARMKARGSFHDDDLLDPGINAYEMMKPTISKILNSAPLLGDDPSHAKRILSAALTRQEYGAAPWLTDRRFLFQDSDSRWRCPSECALMALRRLTIEIADFYKYMLVRQWRDVFPQLVPNRSMLGFAVEYAVTIELSRLGVVFPRAQNRALRMPQNLPLHPLLNVGPVRDLQQGLWVPVQYNYPFIDCVAVWHDSTVTHICAIQITIANDHSDSREGFFQDEWKKWRDAVGSNKSIEWSFAWIYGEFGRPQHKQYKRPRNRQDDAPPTHIAYKMAIEYVSPAVRAALEQTLDRGRG